MTERGAEVQFKGQFCRVIIDGKSFTIGHKHGELCKLNSEPVHTSYLGSQLIKIKVSQSGIVVLVIWVLKI